MCRGKQPCISQRWYRDGWPFGTLSTSCPVKHPGDAMPTSEILSPYPILFCL
ncbi:hypothetical protein PV327_011372, partial [Microctonus hyperodae]